MAASSVDKNERNFLQLHRLVLASTRVLRAKFDSFVPPGKTLQQWLKEPDQAIGLKKAEISKAQLSLIKRSPNTEQFDITLLISLLRHVCYTSKTDKNNPLWDEQDNKKISDENDVADIVRIRNLRNKVSTCFIYYLRVSHTTCWVNITVLLFFEILYYRTYWFKFDRSENFMRSIMKHVELPPCVFKYRGTCNITLFTTLFLWTYLQFVLKGIYSALHGFSTTNPVLTIAFRILSINQNEFQNLIKYQL